MLKPRPFENARKRRSRKVLQIIGTALGSGGRDRDRRFLTRLLPVQNVAVIDPALRADHTVGRHGFGGAVIDVRSQRVQGEATLEVPFRAGDFSPVQTTSATNLDSLAPEPQRGVHGFAHRAPESHAFFELQGDRFGHQLRVEFRPVHFLNVDGQHLTPRPLLDFLAKPVNLGALAADDDPRSGGKDSDLQLVPRPLHFDGGDARRAQLILEPLLQLRVVHVAPAYEEPVHIHLLRFLLGVRNSRTQDFFDLARHALLREVQDVHGLAGVFSPDEVNHEPRLLRRDPDVFCRGSCFHPLDSASKIPQVVLPPAGGPAGFAGAAPGAGPAPAAGGAATAAALSAAILTLCPLKVRVGENSPSLCPTIFSVMYTGINFRTLWTAIV